jgi:hypothetical protein
VSDAPLRRGDFIRLRAEGREVDAMVTLASPNGRALMVMFDARLGGWVASMPILCEDDGTWHALDGMFVEVLPRVAS